MVDLLILAAAHLDHDPSNNRWRNLKSLCQRCHMLKIYWKRSEISLDLFLKAENPFRKNDPGEFGRGARAKIGSTRGGLPVWIAFADRHWAPTSLAVRHWPIKNFVDYGIFV